MKLLVAVVFVALAGCAIAPPQQKTWVRRDMPTAQQTNADWMQCRQYGMQSAMANGLAGNMFVESWILREAHNCMYGLGYE